MCGYGHRLFITILWIYTIRLCVHMFVMNKCMKSGNTDTGILSTVTQGTPALSLIYFFLDFSFTSACISVWDKPPFSHKCDYIY
jgi:hypothetical protein